MHVKSSFFLLLTVTVAVAATTTPISASAPSALPKHNFSRRTDYFFVAKHGDEKRQVNKRRPSRGPKVPSGEGYVTGGDLKKSFTGDDRQNVLLNEVNTGNIVKEGAFFATPFVGEEDEIVHPLLLSETFLPPPPLLEEDPQQLTLETSEAVPFLLLPPLGKSLHPTGEPFLPYAPSFGQRIPDGFLKGKSFSHQLINHPPHPPLLPPQRGPPPPPPPPPPPHRTRGRSLGPPHRRGARPLPPLGPATPAPNNPPPIYRHHTEIKQLEGGKSLQMRAPQHYFDDRSKEKTKDRYAPKYPRHNPLGTVRATLRKRRRGKSSRLNKKSGRKKSSSKKSYRTYRKRMSRRPIHPLVDTLSRPHQRRSSARGRGYTPCHGKKSRSCQLGPKTRGLKKSFRTYSRESRHFRKHSLKHQHHHNTVTVVPFVPVIPPLHGGQRPYGDFHHGVDGGHGRSKSLNHGPPGPKRRTVVVHTRHVYRGLQRPAIHVHERVNFIERHSPYLKEHYGYVSHTFDPLPAYPDIRLAKGIPLHHGFK